MTRIQQKLTPFKKGWAQMAAYPPKTLYEAYAWNALENPWTGENWCILFDDNTTASVNSGTLTDDYDVL